MHLSKDLEKFVLNWAELVSHWGLNRTEAQIYTVLFISPEPLTSEEIADTLNVARSNVSNSLKELESWKIVRVVQKIGDRKKYYEDMKDAWTTFRQVVQEQKRREIEPMRTLLKQNLSHLKEREPLSTQDQFAYQQLTAMFEFFEVTLSWYDKLMALPIEDVKKYLTVGTKIANLFNTTSPLKKG